MTTDNPRARNRVASNVNATGGQRTPGLPILASGNIQIDAWAAKVNERLQVAEGARGSPFDAFIRRRDLDGSLTQLGVIRQNGTTSPSGGGVLVTGEGGLGAWMSVEAFAESIRSTKLYADLVKSVNDPTRFDGFPDKVKAILSVPIAEEAKKRGADIRRLDEKIQTASESFAQTVTEVTAAVAGASAGVRQVMFASASQNRATAGVVTQVQARLDDFDGGGATVEVVMTATADRTAGLAAEYMVKVSAGHAVAGFGLAATEDPSGATTSAFIVQADQFAVTSAYTFAQATTPTATAIGQTWYNTTTLVSKRATATGTGSWVTFTPKIPFGVDTTADTIYIDGQVRINAGGTRLDALGKMVVISVPTQVFKQNSAGTWDATSQTLTATKSGGLTGSVVWTVVSGTYTGSLTDVAGTLSVVRASMTTDSVTFRATVTDTGVNYTDDMTLVKLVDGTVGTSAITGFLTNESASVPASSAGVVSTFAGVTGTFEVFSGITDVTTSATFTVHSNPDNLGGVAINILGQYSISGAGTWSNASTTTNITLRAVYGGVTIDKVLSVTKAVAGAAGTNGTNGSNGAAGTRGSQTFYASGSSWSDATANAKVLAVTGSSTKVIGDTVTISNGTTFSATKYWDGTAWALPGVVIDGNLLVTGSVAAAAINATSLSAISANLGTVTAGSIHGTADIDITGGARLGGFRTSGSFLAAVAVNEAFAADNGIVSYATGAAVRAGVYGIGTSGATGVGGSSSGGNAIQGVADSVGGVGVFAQGALGAFALSISGSTTINAGQFSTLTTSVATFAGTKPGSATTNQHLAVYKAGVLGWVPWWPDV